MYLIVGLGNPGRAYQAHRHNIGFMAVDELHREGGLPDFKEKFSGLFSKGDGYALLKPTTFMNLSGESVQPAAAFLKVEPSHVVVLHDELDLSFADVRLKFGGGHAGHNGLRSIIARLGTPDFARVRMGIGKPPPGFQGAVADYVLSGFDPVEVKEVPDVVAKALVATRAVLKEGVHAAMNAFNQRLRAGS